MQMDDMILVSIDDHMIEPPDMYENHVPAKWKDKAPKVVRNENGVDEWEFQGQKTSTPFGMAATVGWPREEWGFNPGSRSEEHTSELQSLMRISYAVFCLKKKKKITPTNIQ